MFFLVLCTNIHFSDERERTTRLQQRKRKSSVTRTELATFLDGSKAVAHSFISYMRGGRERKVQQVCVVLFYIIINSRSDSQFEEFYLWYNCKKEVGKNEIASYGNLYRKLL